MQTSTIFFTSAVALTSKISIGSKTICFAIARTGSVSSSSPNASISSLILSIFIGQIGSKSTYTSLHLPETFVSTVPFEFWGVNLWLAFPLSSPILLAVCFPELLVSSFPLLVPLCPSSSWWSSFLGYLPLASSQFASGLFSLSSSLSSPSLLSSLPWGIPFSLLWTENLKQQKWKKVM